MNPHEDTGRRPLWARAAVLVYRVALALPVLALGVMAAWAPVLGAHDFWAHAAVGRWIAEHGRVPDHTLFLWTANEPWVFHSWLTQLTFYGLTRLGGPESRGDAVLAFTTFFALAPFALAWVLWGVRGRFTCWMAVPFVLAVQSSAHRFQPRPELFTCFFLGLLLAFLIARDGAPADDLPSRRRRAIEAALLAVAFCVWGNLHGAVVIGVQVLVVTAVCDFVQNRRDGRWKWVALLAVVAPLAVCVNPYGPAYWLALQPVGSERFSQIVEWFPVWKAPELPEQLAVPAAVLGALAALSWAINPRRRLAHLGWLLMLAGMFLLARRNQWPFTVACVFVLAANARAVDPAALWERLARRLRRGRGEPPPPPAVLRGVLRAAVLAWVLLEVWTVFAARRTWGVNYVPTRLENGIVRFVLDHRLDGRVFNDYENSSYFEWRWAGRPALYIDLLNAYPDQVMLDYFDIARANDRGLVLLEEQQIEVAVLTTNRGPFLSLRRLADHLDASPGWVRVYAAADGVIWVRRAPKYEHVWRPLQGKVPATKFRTLENWGDEGSVILPGAAP